MLPQGWQGTPNPAIIWKQMSVGLTTGLLLLHRVTKRTDISLPLTCPHPWIIDVLLFYLAHEFLKQIKLPVHVKQYDVLGIYTRLVSFFVNSSGGLKHYFI